MPRGVVGADRTVMRSSCMGGEGSFGHKARGSKLG